MQVIVDKTAGPREQEAMAVLTGHILQALETGQAAPDGGR